MKITIWAVLEDNDNGLNARLFADEHRANTYFAECLESYIGSECHTCNGARVTDNRTPCPECDGEGRVDLDDTDSELLTRLRDALTAKDYGEVFDVRSDMSDKDYFRFDSLSLDSQDVELPSE